MAVLFHCLMNIFLFINLYNLSIRFSSKERHGDAKTIILFVISELKMNNITA